MARTRKQHRSYFTDTEGNLLSAPRGRKFAKTSLTRPHRILIRICEELGLEWEDETRFGRYSLDVYVPGMKLCLECDGVYFHSLPGAAEKDARRDRWLLENHGIRTLRFTDVELENDRRSVIDAIIEATAGQAEP